MDTPQPIFIHEDDWGMIDLIPAENLAHSRKIVEDARAFGDAHFVGGGWTDMFIVPDVAYPLSVRNLLLTTLETAFGGLLPLTTAITTGYSSTREPVATGFAFRGAGVMLYGTRRDGIVQSLHFARTAHADTNRLPAILTELHAVARTHDLILVDYWQDVIVDLRDDQSVERYFTGTDE